MTVDLDVCERPQAGRGQRGAYAHQLRALREPIARRAQPGVSSALDYPVIPITSNLDTIPTVVGASSIILLKLFMLGLLLFSL